MGLRLGILTAILGVSGAFAQMVNMQEVAQALGVKCEYCHARMAQAQAEGNAALPAETAPRRHLEIAAAMITMTRDLNAQVIAATGKPANETTRVTCITCHRGVAIPGQLSDILARTALEKGPDAAVARYRDLRAQYYGRQSYDFSEDTLFAAAEKVVRVKPAASIPLLRLNIEFYPKAVRNYAQIAFAYTRDLDDESAIATLEKALEIEPENGAIRGQLEQLKSYHRKSR
jgi:tetratricopeptide (TPR) repeat protein